MAKFLTFRGLWPLPWPWIRSYCTQSCITYRPLPTYQISLKSKKLFCGQTDGRANGHSRPTLLGRPDQTCSIKVIFLTKQTDGILQWENGHLVQLGWPGGGQSASRYGVWTCACQDSIQCLTGRLGGVATRHDCIHLGTFLSKCDV